MPISFGESNKKFLNFIYNKIYKRDAPFMFMTRADPPLLRRHWEKQTN